MADLEKQFDQAMLQIYLRAKTEAKYPANVFFNMLNDRGGLATAKYLINTDTPSQGYTELHLAEAPRPHGRSDGDREQALASALHARGARKSEETPQGLPLHAQRVRRLFRRLSSVWLSAPSLRQKGNQRENFLYLIRCGIVESVPSRRFLSSS
jgi:hypothetical protein